MVYAAIVLVAGILWTHGAAALPPFHSHQQVMNAFPSKFPTTEAFLEHVVRNKLF